ncbi:MAG: hypothetical protein LBB48_10695 [Treponema sp.]|nr:hypothetical protein [Treponema sp.]
MSTRPGDIHNADKHPATFRFRVHAPLRALANRVAVETECLAEAPWLQTFPLPQNGHFNPAAIPSASKRLCCRLG